jgi:hypothetical protein
MVYKVRHALNAVLIAGFLLSAAPACPTYAAGYTVDWLHAFYAVKAYEQRELIRDLDAVTFAWSTMRWNKKDGARLDTSFNDDGYWYIPDGYEELIDYARESGVTANLGVFMNIQLGLDEMLADTNDRLEAVRAITKEAARVYPKIGRRPYDGVTVDFEGLTSEEYKVDFVFPWEK